MANTAEPQKFRAPSHLTRAERRAFRDLIAARSGSGKSVSATYLDLLVDYVAARSRIRELTKTWRSAVCPEPSITFMPYHPYGVPSTFWSETARGAKGGWPPVRASSRPEVCPSPPGGNGPMMLPPINRRCETRRRWG